MAGLEGREALEAAIAEIDRQIENLQKAKQALLGLPLLGGTVSSVPLSPNPTSSPSLTSIPDPLALVREQEFHGLSMAEAARVFLKRVGSQKTATILAAIQKGGVQYTSKFPGSALYVAMKRHSAFVSLKKNWWNLAERRPDLAEQQRESKRRVKTRKRGKGRVTSRMKQAVQTKDGHQETASVGIANE